MSEHLYEIAGALATIGDEVIKAEGEVSEELEKKLDDCNLAFAEKVHGIARWCVNLKSWETAIESEIARLTARRKSLANLEERLKEYTKMNMEKTGKTKLEFSLFTVSIVKNPPSVSITDSTLIPPRYVEIKVEPVIKKKELLEDLKAGKEVSGAKLINDKTRIQIR